MKLIKYSFIILSLAIISCASYSKSVPKVKIASWNVRYLSTGSRNAEEVNMIASIISKFDLVAVQEARDYEVLDRLERKLPGWKYEASKEVGRGQKEIYAYFWKEDKISLIGDCFTFNDPGDGFIREPYVCTFIAGEFDFTLSTIHLLYGDSKADRRHYATESFVTEEPVEDCPYVASENSNVFHRASCSSAKRINEENKVCFGSREEAIESGRRPCKRCNP